MDKPTVLILGGYDKGGEFDGLITALYGINGPDADPLDLCFWLQNRYGSTQGVLRAELTLHWHRPGEG